MRISTKGRYSLEALLCLALLPEGEYASTRAIAENTGISDGYLEQLFIPLRRAGIIQGIRGPQGGYIPGKALDEIRVGDVLRAVEGALEPVPCVKPKFCPIENSCQSHQAWKELYDEINSCVDSITVADLVSAYYEIEKAEAAL